MRGDFLRSESNATFTAVRSIAIFVIVAIAAGFTANVRAQAPVRCEVLAPPTPSGLESWDKDFSYDLRVQQTPAGLSVHVIGDKVLVNARNTASLTRSPADAATNIAELVLDGRTVIIESPLSLATGKLRIIAETLEIRGDGRLSITKKNAMPDGLEVYARQLRIARGLARPLDISAVIESNRAVKIAAQDVYEGQTAVPAERVATFLWSRTIDSAFQADPPTNWSVVHGNDAETAYRTALDAGGVWPARFIAQIAAHLARDPYGDPTREAVKAAMKEARPTLTGYQDPKPLLDLLRFEALIQNGLDLNGRPAAFAPRKGLNFQLAELQKDLSALGTSDSYLAALRDLYIAAAEQPQLERSVADALRNRIAEGELETRAVTSDLDSKMTMLATLTQEAEAVRPLLAQRQAIVKTLTEREIKRQRDASSIKQWTTLGATGVALGAMLIPGGQAIGAGIAAGIGTAGEVAYQHNTDGLGWSDLGTIAAKGTSIYQASMALSETWEEYKKREHDFERVLQGDKVLIGDPPEAGKPDRRERLTIGKAASRAGEALGAVGSSVSTLTSGLGQAGPTPVNLTKKEAEDPEMIGHIDHLARLAKQQSDVIAEIDAANLRLATLKTTTDAERMSLTRLLEAHPTNDRELYRWQANAKVLWNLEITRIADAAALLRRSLFFETGRLPVGPADALYYPSEYSALTQHGGADPFTAYQGTGMTDRLRAHLTEQEKRFLVSVDALVRGVLAARDAYLSTRTDATVYRFSHTFRRASAVPAEAAFVAALNGQLAQQIGLKTPATAILPAPVPIHFASPTLDLPERVVNVRVTGIEFASPVDLQGSGLRFTLVHPGVGELRRGPKCVVADLRVPGGENRRIYVTDVNAIDRDWPKREPTSVSLTAVDRFYVFFPLRTMYTALAQVTTQNWASIPEITSIELSWEVMQ